MRWKWLMGLAAAGALCWLAPYSAVQAKKAPPVKVELPAKKGNVVFPHKKHHKELKIKCKTCHHKMDEVKDKMACRQCHLKKQFEAPRAMTAFHKSCRGCHIKMKKQGKNPPTKCKECHKK